MRKKKTLERYPHFMHKTEWFKNLSLYFLRPIFYGHVDSFFFFFAMSCLFTNVRCCLNRSETEQESKNEQPTEQVMSLSILF